ncbi:MAG: hypothetical protein LBE35_07975 [Clostridiales bacterium]|nr:hypothetical protein [Clostridiales bacterium]
MSEYLYGAVEGEDVSNCSLIETKETYDEWVNINLWIRQAKGITSAKARGVKLDPTVKKSTF